MHTHTNGCIQGNLGVKYFVQGDFNMKPEGTRDWTNNVLTIGSIPGASDTFKAIMDPVKSFYMWLNDRHSRLNASHQTRALFKVALCVIYNCATRHAADATLIQATTFLPLCTSESSSEHLCKML